MLSKQLLKITSLFAILFVILISCSKDNGGPAVSQTTVQEDKQNITSTFDGFYSCLNKLDDGDLSSFLLYSMFNNTSQVYNDSYLNTVFNKFKLQHGQLILNDKLQFASLTGIYTYNPVNSIWTKTSSSSVITLKFPSISTNNNVDSELTLNSYSDQNVIYNSKNKWLPTSASLSLKRNNTTLFSIAISNVQFDVNTNFSMPINADISIFTAPFTHTFQWRRTTTTDFRFSYSNSTTDGCGTSFSTNVKLYDADYGNITSIRDDVKTISGDLINGNLKVVYTANVQGLSVFNSPTPTQINNFVDAEVFYNNLKIGDLVYDKVNGKSKISIVFSDGSTQNIQDYVGSFQTQVESIFSRFLN